MVEAAADRLANVRPQVAGLLGSGKLIEASKIVDDVLLVGELGMSRANVRVLRDAHAELTARRGARGRRGSN